MYRTKYNTRMTAEAKWRNHIYSWTLVWRVSDAYHLKVKQTNCSVIYNEYNKLIMLHCVQLLLTKLFFMTYLYLSTCCFISKPSYLSFYSMHISRLHIFLCKYIFIGHVCTKDLRVLTVTKLRRKLPFEKAKRKHFCPAYQEFFSFVSRSICGFDQRTNVRTDTCSVILVVLPGVFTGAERLTKPLTGHICKTLAFFVLWSLNLLNDTGRGGCLKKGRPSPPTNSLPRTDLRPLDTKGQKCLLFALCTLLTKTFAMFRLLAEPSQMKHWLILLLKSLK